MPTILDENDKVSLKMAVLDIENAVGSVFKHLESSHRIYFDQSSDFSDKFIQNEIEFNVSLFKLTL